MASDPKIIIHANAIVTASSHIDIETERDASPPLISESPPANVKLIVAGGNLFHPHSRLIVMAPSYETHDSTQNDSEELVIRIEENNIFEEHCNVILDLREVKKPEGGGVINIVGSYNQFAPRSHVKSNQIGNANIFQPVCNLDIPNIRNGNIFGSTLEVTAGADKKNLVDDNHDEARFFQEKVVYIVRDTALGVNQQIVRPHIHGMKRNMREVALLLSAARKIAESNTY